MKREFKVVIYTCGSEQVGIDEDTLHEIIFRGTEGTGCMVDVEEIEKQDKAMKKKARK